MTADGRIMALDVGDKWIGVAVSDETRSLAIPLSPVAGGDRAEALGRVRQLVDQWQVAEIVVGLPLNLDGSEGPQAAKTRAWARKLQGIAPVRWWDERLTTRQAERLLIAQGLSRTRRKAVIDGVAAMVMLQAYLDHLENKPRKRGDASVSEEKDFSMAFGSESGEDDEEEVIVLTDEEGQEHEFVVVDVIEVEQREYAILLPIDTEDDEEAEAVILRLEKDQDGEEILVDIDSDEEWEKVAAAYEEMLEEEEGSEEE